MYFERIISTSDRPEFSMKALQNRGVLATPNFVRIQSGVDVTISKTQAGEDWRTRDIDASALRNLGNEARRNALIAKRCIDLASQGRSALVFACNVAHSRFLASLLLSCGVSARHIDGETDSGLRGDAIEAYRNGNVKVLCNFGLLTTGFDAPNTFAVILARPTTSPVLFSQMVGRALRGPRMGGLANTQVIDIQDNYQLHGQPIDLFEYFRSQWLEWS
jgi:superfamily II DNA or RNA helicase